MTTDAQDEFLRIARDRYKSAVEAETEIREKAARDLRFLVGDQWEEGQAEARRKNDRPALTINKLPPFVDQIVNEQRKNRPGGKISPVGDGATDKQADIFQGLIRHIEYTSQADAAYDTAFDYGVSSSFGYWRYTTEYIDDRSLDQEIRVTRIADPATVRFDPAATEVDYSDAMWAFVEETITQDEFKRRYPKARTTTSSFFELGSSPAPDWMRDGNVRIAEYWQVELEEEELKMFHGLEPDPEKAGAFVIKTRGFFGGEKIPPHYQPLLDDEGEQRGRTVERRKVCRYDINGAEVLGKKKKWAGRYIPIVPMLGKEKFVEGKRVLMSAIRFALDPQQLYNFYKTGEAEVVQQTPKSPYIGVLGQFKSSAQKWGTSNIVPYAFLEYDPVAVGGALAPAPQRQSYTPATEALAIGAGSANEDIKGTIGLYDASRGKENSAADSGKAILALQQQGDTATYHFFDNFMRSMWHGYRILLDLIPHIYDAPRVIRIVKPDDKTELIQINQIFTGEDGKPVHYDMQAGRYDVVMSVGPSYNTRKQAAAAQLQGLAQADPASLPQWADLYVKQLDLGPIGDEISERLTPPQFRKQDGADPQQLQQAAQQLTAQNKQLVDQVHQLSQVIETKQQEQQAKVDIARMVEDTKRANAELEAATRLSIAEIQTKAQSQARLSSDAFAAMQQHESMAHDAATQAQEHAHALEQSQQQHVQTLEQGDQQAAQQQQQQAQAQQAAQQQPQQVQQ